MKVDSRKAGKQEREGSKMKIKPLGDRVLVEPEKEGDVKKGGIIIPDTAQEKPQEGKVVALGTGKLDDNGKKIPFNVKVNDRVLMPKYGGTEVKIGDKEYQITFQSAEDRWSELEPKFQEVVDSFTISSSGSAE